MKLCKGCNLELEEENFSRFSRSPDGLDYKCRKCKKAVSAERYSKGLTRKSTLKNVYNLSPEELEQMYIQQEGKCQICGVFKPVFNKQGGLYVDHCHSSNQVRGLLCNSCNVMLGLAKDNTEILLNAINYLRTH